jgi:hypothetical protein
MDTNEQTTREPLLSDAAIEQEVNPEDPNNYSTREYYESIGCKWVRDFYEAKITSGELRVVEEVENYYTEPIKSERFGCPKCDSVWERKSVWSKNAKIRVMNYCPGCGNKIIKP